VNYKVRFECYQTVNFYAPTQEQAEAIAQALGRILDQTTFRLYSLGNCPQCHRTTETYLSLWQLRDDVWMIVPA